MDVDVELGLLDRGSAYSIPSSTASSQETLFGGGKVHPGYGASKLPLRPSGSGAAAGQAYDKIFQSQLGAAASDPNNPIGEAFYRKVYGYTNKEQYDRETFALFRKHGLLAARYQPAPGQKYSQTYKPYELPWNKETKSQWPQHWKLVNPRAGQKKNQNKQKPAKESPSTQELKSGLTLPFSNNIGPGNTIQEPISSADAIAEAHDRDYQNAKKDSDVLQADKQAISSFAHEAIYAKDPVSGYQAAVGAVGLGVKHAVESAIGKVLYGKSLCLEHVLSALLQWNVPIGIV